MKAHKELIEKHCMAREGLAMHGQKLCMEVRAGVRTCKCPRSVANIQYWGTGGLGGGGGVRLELKLHLNCYSSSSV